MFESTLEKIISKNWQEFPKYNERHIIPEGTINSQISLALLGPRRAGKSTYLFQIRDMLVKNGADKKQFIILNFEDPDLVGFRPENFNEIIDVFQKISPKTKPIFLIDEPQAVDNWFLFIRKLVDQQFRTIITGSNSTLLSKEIASKLGARTHGIRILPLSFKEYLEFNGLAITDEVEFITKKTELQRHFEAFEKFGGFPEIAKEDDGTKTTALKTYLNLIVTDVVKRHKLNEQNILLIIKKIRENIGNEFSIKSILDNLQSIGFIIGERQIYEYFAQIEQAFLTESIQQYKKSFAKRHLFRKTYFIDSGFLTLYDTTSEDLGIKLENTIFLELIKKDKEVFYFKEKGECDFITKGKTGILEAIQVTYELNFKNKEREVNGLLAAMKYLDLNEGTIITFNQEDELKENGKTIHIKPAWKWALQ